MLIWQHSALATTLRVNPLMAEPHLLQGEVLAAAKGFLTFVLFLKSWTMSRMSCFIADGRLFNDLGFVGLRVKKLI